MLFRRFSPSFIKTGVSMALLYVFVICLCSQSLFEDRFCHLRCREAGNLMWRFSRKDTKTIPISNPSHSIQIIWIDLVVNGKPKPTTPLKRVLKNETVFSKGHVGWFNRKGSNLRRPPKTPARLRPGRLGCRSSDLKPFSPRYSHHLHLNTL